MKRIQIFVVFSLSFLIVSAQGAKLKTQKTPSGMEYKIFTSTKGGTKIVAGDFTFFKLKGILSDSTIFDSRKNEQTPYMTIEVHEGFQKANFEEALTFLAPGDSGVFLINADSFYSTYINSTPPEFAKKGSPIYFYIKIDSVITKLKLAKLREDQQNEIKGREQNESKLIDEYLNKEDYVYMKTASGMYYAIYKTTTGALAKNGDQVSAIYTGKLLNGKVFDSNKSSGQPFDFKLGAHQVIAGWDEIFSILKVGECAKIVLPSSLGYGAQGAGADIGPYTPLVFEVEFVKITKQD